MSEPDNILVSVIMPAYNAELYIAESIESALKQTLKALEVIVVDDGSNDKTVEIAESFGKRVRVFRQKNGGAATARNYAVNQARGDWIAFLDSDDLWNSEKIETQISNCPNMVWSHTNYVFIGSGHDGTVKSSERAPQYGGNVLSNLVINNFIGTSTVIMRRETFLELGGFDESLRAIQDWDLWLRAASKYELGYIPQTHAKYRVHAASTSRSARKTLPNHLEVINNTFAKGGAGEAIPNLKSHALANSYGVCSLIAEESHDTWFALRCALWALLYQPGSLWRWRSVIRILLLEVPGVFIGRN